MKKAIFLDRDGVINKVELINGKPYPPMSIDGLVLLPKVNESLEFLKNAGYLLIVITNQPDVTRGKANREAIEFIHEFMKKTLPLNDIFTCYHDDHDNCSCRKPKPGNILEAANLYDIDLQKSFMIGDRWRDIEAGIKAGCKTFFIDYGYQEKKPTNYDFKVKSLYEAVKIILKLN
jgi:D-glycero-D-manno-heptose 1,7-bisphosphate phosphatase